MVVVLVWGWGEQALVAPAMQIIWGPGDPTRAMAFRPWTQGPKAPHKTAATTATTAEATTTNQTRLVCSSLHTVCRSVSFMKTGATQTSVVFMVSYVLPHRLNNSQQRMAKPCGGRHVEEGGRMVVGVESPRRSEATHAGRRVGGGL
jgi:hypothetical protein